MDKTTPRHVFGLSKNLWGILAVATYYANLGGLIDQIQLTWHSGVVVLSFWLLILWAVGAFSFCIWGLTEERTDWFKVVARGPGLYLILLATWQYRNTIFSVTDAISILGGELACLWMFRYFVSHHQRIRNVIFQAGRTAFTLATSVGFALQIFKFHEIGTEHASLIYWILIAISYFVWLPYGNLSNDRVLFWVHVLAIGMILVNIFMFFVPRSSVVERRQQYSNKVTI